MRNFNDDVESRDSIDHDTATNKNEGTGTDTNDETGTDTNDEIGTNNNNEKTTNSKKGSQRKNACCKYFWPDWAGLHSWAV